MADTEWIEWAGGKWPVPLTTEVQAKFACGDTSPVLEASAFDWGWRYDGEYGDIIAYRVVSA